MINFIKLLLYPCLLLILALIYSCDADDTQTVAELNNLVFADEFDVDGAPNPAKWNIEIGRGPNNDGWGNQELQYYTNRTENVKVENGYLLITAINEPYNGSPYTSARLTTENKFEQEYGRFEARMRLPYGQGMWPAFWLLGNDCNTNQWPNCGEIDIMEFKGQEPNRIHGSVHGPGYSASEAVTKQYELQNNRFDTEFHVFGIEWSPTAINFYVDGDLYNQITQDDIEGEWVFNHPFYMLLNLAIGGNYVGHPNNETEFPQTMLVDYVRVYQ